MMDPIMNNKADGQEEQDPHPPSEVGIPLQAQSGMEEKEHLRVYLRIRPFTSAETDHGESQDCVTIEPPDTVVVKPPRVAAGSRLSTERPLPVTGQHFQFSQVYGPQTTQAELFVGTVKDLVKDVLRGGNSLVFTYGVTNAGKTFTFQGPDGDVGLLPRSLDLVFGSIGERVVTDTIVKPHRCREFVHLSEEQQAEEAAFKRGLLRQLKESERSNLSLLSSSSSTLFQGSSVQEETSAADEALSPELKDAKFSVWVSFCEIYNENVHDLLEVTPTGAPRRAALRLSQDVKGNAFIKDLRWVQVNNADEAYRVMKLGKKNQSFSSTRLNQLSSRSHSIFSLRILRMAGVGAPRVLAVSELCLCDLAGSERCAKTLNQGERLKEAGNINTSLLILGKCINALRHNQQARLLQHVPFRESKLTHYLQGFFCGRGRACMIVNINQCASMYDETLNVLKFSAVAQKVVVVSSRPPPIMPCRSGSEGSSAGAEGMTSRGSRRSSLIGWESSLEDVQEDEDGGEEQSLMDLTGDQSLHHHHAHQGGEQCDTERRAQQQQVAQLQLELKKVRADSVLLEAQVREEVSREFSDLFSQMQNDFEDRVLREREILEERAERRLEIFKNLVDQMAGSVPVTMESSVDSLLSEVADIQRAAEAACEGLASRGAAAGGDGGDKQSHQSSVFPLREAEAGEHEEKRRLHLQLQQLQKQVADLQAQHLASANEVGGASIAPEEERRAKDEDLVALEAERRAREDVAAELAKESQRRKQECDALRQEVAELRGKLEAEEQQVSNERQRAEQASVQLEAAQAREAKLSEEIQEKSSQVLALTQQLHTLTQEAQTTAPSPQLSEKVSELLTKLAQETEKRESVEKLLWEQQQELASQQLDHRQEVDQLKEKLKQQTVVSEQHAAELKEKLMELQAETEQDKAPHAEVKGQSQSAEKLPEHDATSQHQLEELQVKLEEERKACKQLRAQLEEAQALKSQNVNLLAEVATLRAKLSNVEEQGQQSEETRASTEVQKKLEEAEERIGLLQTNLQEALQRREEEEAEAAQEVRRREVERRRELLAVAHEAIAQKDAELEKKAEEISRLKENARQDSDKVSSLSRDLERQQEDASDLREKLADYKKQMQQVQKEISAMKEEERTLKQKLSDVDKAKKQLQSDLVARDRTIQQLRAEQSADRGSDQSQQLYQKVCKDLEAKQQVVEDMRATLMEQEETQVQMEQLLEEKISLAQELSDEVTNLKGLMLQQSRGTLTPHQGEEPSDDIKAARQEASRAQESLKLCTEKHQAERRRWQEEKLSLIGQVKEAEDKRNQEMKKFAEDRERHARQQSQLESQLSDKEQTMDTWRRDRDTLVSALEVQLQKLLSSQAEKDQVIQQLRQDATPPPEDGGQLAELQAAVLQREEQISQLREELKAAADKQQEAAPQVDEVCSTATLGQNIESESIQRRSGGKRVSVISQSSTGFPSVLDSSEISTENGRTSRFPRPELEISFSPLQPNRMALRRQGEESAVTVKISRTARKRKSGDMEKSHIFRRSKRQATRQEEVEVVNRRNTRSKLMSKLTPHQEEAVSPATRQDSQSSIRSRKEATLQKIGDFLQSSPTLLGSKAKKMMSLVSGRSHAADTASSSSSSSLRAKKNKRKLFRPEISSPMDLPSHTIISQEPEEKESDHQIIKRRLRSRTAK